MKIFLHLLVFWSGWPQVEGGGEVFLLSLPPFLVAYILPIHVVAFALFSVYLSNK